MRTIQGPALFLAQFAGDTAPFNSFDAITRWAADCGYAGVQLPSWDARLFDLDLAASSQGYCDDLKGRAADNGITITELSTHLQGQLVAVHPAYDLAFDGFAASAVRGNPAARALSEGFQDATKGTAVSTAPTAPVPTVAAIRNLRRLSSTSGTVSPAA